MSGLNLIPFFIIGLLGSVHCIGMCGGIVAALSGAAPRKPFPVSVITANTLASGTSYQLLYVVAYNTGRISSYVVAGMIAGGAMHGVQTLAQFSAIQATAYWLINLILIVLGLHLMNIHTGLAYVEKLGMHLWRNLQPITKWVLPADSLAKMLGMGALWGWLPCSMVYSMLLTAMLSGSAIRGAGVMLAFGIGTLPMLLALGMMGTRIRDWIKRPGVRMVCGLIVLSFGLLGLVRAAGLAPAWSDLLCIHSEHVS